MTGILCLTPLFLFALAAALPHNPPPQAGNSPSHRTVQTSSKYSTGNAQNIVANDKLRLQQLSSSKLLSQSLNANGSSPQSVSTESLSPTFLMTINVGVGSPPTNFELLVDTGSSNFVVGANPAGQLFVTTASTEPTGEEVSVSYGSGFFVGDEFSDDVTIGNLPTVRQSLAVPNISEGFNLFDGIVGLGLQGLTEGTLLKEPNQTIPTITDTLSSNGTIPQNLIALTVPLSSNSAQDGSIDFGRPDFSKNTSSISFTPLLNTSDTAGFWSLSQTITYGNTSAPLATNAPGIVDSGTSFFLIPTAAFQTYMNLTGATIDPFSGLLTIDNADSLQSLFFDIGGDTPLEFTANAQLFPRDLLAEVGLNTSTTYLIIADGDTASGGIDLVMGFVVLERFYSVFDARNSQVGFANNAQTFATSN